MRIIDRFSFVMVLLGVIWLAIPSSLFLRLQAYIIEDGMITIVRETPYGNVLAEVSDEIISATGLTCVSGGAHEAIFEVAPNNTVRLRAHEWMVPCLKKPMIYTSEIKVFLFGLIPLRPVRFTTAIE
ncbi:hypothetical protein [Halovulum sp. GXIMD14793]